MIVAAVLGLAFTMQATQEVTMRANAQSPTPSSVPAPTDTSATAMRANVAPVIDAKGDDPVWASVPVISGFKQWRPTEGKEARFKTEAKIAYDASNLYVLVRAFDPHPDSIQKLLERRDSFTSSDMIWLFIDSYHDRRSGFEFGINPAGVKRDIAIINDQEEAALRHRACVLSYEEANS